MNNSIPFIELNELTIDGLRDLKFILIGAHGNSSLLFQIQVESLQPLKWFIDNEPFIRNEELEYSNASDLGYAEFINQLFDTISDEEEYQFWEYRSRHGIHFAFEGYDVPRIYIGRFNNTHYISCDEADLKFNFEIDIESFFSEIHKKLNDF